MNKKLFALWKYDLFPYLVGGEVLDMNDEGFVEALDKGYWFKPVKLLPLEKGKKLYAKLMDLKSEHRKAKEKLHEEYMQKVKEVMGDA